MRAPSVPLVSRRRFTQFGWIDLPAGSHEFTSIRSDFAHEDARVAYGADPSFRSLVTLLAVLAGSILGVGATIVFWKLD